MSIVGEQIALTLICLSMIGGFGLFVMLWLSWTWRFRWQVRMNRRQPYPIAHVKPSRKRV